MIRTQVTVTVDVIATDEIESRKLPMAVTAYLTEMVVETEAMLEATEATFVVTKVVLA